MDGQAPEGLAEQDLRVDPPAPNRREAIIIFQRLVDAEEPVHSVGVIPDEAIRESGWVERPRLPTVAQEELQPVATGGLQERKMAGCARQTETVGGIDAAVGVPHPTT